MTYSGPSRVHASSQHVQPVTVGQEVPSCLGQLVRCAAANERPTFELHCSPVVDRGHSRGLYIRRVSRLYVRTSSQSADMVPSGCLMRRRSGAGKLYKA